MTHVRWHGHDLVLLAARAVWWPARRTLIAADLHVGKPATFRAAGIPVPECVTGSDLVRLGRVLDATGAERLVILGDLLHAPQGRAPETLERVCEWRGERPDLPIVLVRGNHDRSAGDPPPEWRIETVDGPWEDAGVLLAHEPPERGPALCGHLHPCVRMRGGVGGAVRAPCFWFGEQVAVLPAFGGFTGGATIRARPGDRVFAIGPEGEIVEARGEATTTGGRR